MAVEYHFRDVLRCGHEQIAVAFVDPDSVIATHMEAAWAVPCYQCPKVDGHTALVERDSFTLIEVIENP